MTPEEAAKQFGVDMEIAQWWRVRGLLEFMDPSDEGTLLTPAETATHFRVCSQTITRWAKRGELSHIRTLGGHRRYRLAEVRALLAKKTANRG